MTREELVAKVAKDAGISKVQARKVLDSFISIIMIQLKKGERVNLSGFGVFVIHSRKPRVGRNPQTGTAIKIAAKKVAKFSPGRELIASLVGRKGFYPDSVKPAAGSPATQKTAAKVVHRKKYAIVTVHYATDRKKENSGQSKILYGSERASSGKISMGKCEISVPLDRKLGSLHGRSWWRFIIRKDPRYEVLLEKTIEQNKKEYLKELNNGVKKTARKELFVFVHGFGVTFEDAARRTGQLAYDLGFAGPAIFFSWPSKGKISPLNYTADESSIEWSMRHLEDFLENTILKTGAQSVHLIAHSMGNRSLASAIETLAIKKGPGCFFHNIILTAPDIDLDTFVQLSKIIGGTAKRVTLYANSNDRALAISKGIHKNRRLGDSSPEPYVMPGVDTIDVSSIDTSFSGHSYYGENRSVISDLFSLITNDLPPERRFGLRALKTSLGLAWVFSP